MERAVEYAPAALKGEGFGVLTTAHNLPGRPPVAYQKYDSRAQTVLAV